MKRYTPAEEKDIDIAIADASGGMDGTEPETWNEAWHEFEELYDLILGGSHDTTIRGADTINTTSYNK